MTGESPPISNDQEHQRLLTALRESEILRELAELLTASLDLKRILHVLVKRTTEVCEVERCSVWLLEEDRGVFRPAAYHLSSAHLNSKAISAADQVWYQGSLLFDDPEIYRLLQEKGMIVLEDLHAHSRVRTIAETFLVRSVLLVALIREGHLVGMLSLDDPGKMRTFSAEQQQLARAIGQQAALAIDNARLYQQAQTEQKRAERLIGRAQAIYQVAMAVNSGEDLSAVLNIAVQHLVRGLDADSGAIALLDRDTLRLVSITEPQQNSQSGEAKLHNSIHLAELPNCSQAAMTGNPVFVTAQQAEGAEKLLRHELGLENVIIVPLMVGTNHPGERSTTAAREVPTRDAQLHSLRCVGLALVSYKTLFHPSRGQYAFAQDIAAQCALAIEKAQLLVDARQAAALATERANTLDAIFHAMTEGIAVLSQDGQVLIRNNAASHFLGESLNSTDQLKELLKRHPAYTLDGQPITTDYFPLFRALRGERIRGERFVTKRVDGVERVVELNIAPLFDSTEKQTGIVSAFRDITEQTRIERRIHQALETMLHIAVAVSGITEIKDILRSILEMTLTTMNCDRGSVYLYDEDQQSFTPLLSVGFSSEAEEHWLSEQGRWLSPEASKYKEAQAQLMEGFAILLNPEQYPYLPDLLNDNLILATPITYSDRVLGLMLLDRSSIPTYDTELEQGQPHEFTIWDMAVIEGIAQLAGLAIEQARWQQEATDARTSESAMREANALKDEFLSITAHEFRTPLTIILAHSQMALRTLRRTTDTLRWTTDQEQTSTTLNESLSIIEKQAKQLTNIVNTFLEVTQINRGQLMLKSEEVDLASIAEQVATNHSATSADHEIRCIIEPCERPYLVKGDSARLTQIITNLMQNAIKYSPLGGPITLSLHQRTAIKGKALIETCVADTGIGVPKEAQPRLFERFYRAPNIEGSNTRGIGLGLYVVAELLHLHGGTIHVESSGVFGEGSRFIFTIPLLEREIENSD